MKKTVLVCASLFLLAACSQSSTDVASPNSDTGIDQHNTVVNAEPDTAAGAGATASSGMGASSAHGASVNESTNTTAKPPHHPPVR